MQGLQGEAGSAAFQTLGVLVQQGGHHAASCLTALGAAEALTEAALKPETGADTASYR